MITISLDRQIHIYSVDTGSFYTNKERRLHWKIHEIQKEKNALNANSERYKDYKTKAIARLKSKLSRTLALAVKYNDESKHKKFRCLSEDACNTKNIVSIFESSLTRTIGAKINELTTDIIIVKVYYFDIIKDLIKNGFYCGGEKYKFFTASAGQIRTKKTVFIKESLWDKYERVLMCGLTVDKINQLGGINVNKYLAYLALSNSATDHWKEFDITKCIVVDDFQTVVHGMVDYINDSTYEIVRRNMGISIEHTDGCGMILPSLSRKNFMIRMPWVKGLLAPFDFVKFIKEHGGNHVIQDIYGKEHDILKEDIQIIFCKSQFKMHKYYSSWREYVDNFIKYECQAGTCNKEENHISNAKINYQMIQTLSDMSMNELKKISKKSIDKLNNLSTTVKSMLEAFGVTKYNTNKTYLQQALEIYPELLSDIYTKEVLRSIKKSLIREYKSAKLEVRGKYTFLVPDLYAFCERLFLNRETPGGLLKNGEVFCRLYKYYEKLDCLRSPHLFVEHAVRKNIVDDIRSKWFTTDAVYTSSHDLISKMLQFDNDGDRSLVVADENIIRIAERNMADIVPLYYEMKKANPTILNNQSIYEGLEAAYTGGNIGVISNDISKVWNSGEITQEKLNIIKILCMENNFVIDQAKTLYKPVRPYEINLLVKQFTKSKLPYFFKYAKDKEIHQIEPKTDTVVNWLDDIIKSKNLRFDIKEFGKFSYEVLMNNPHIDVDDQLINKYIKFNRKYHFQINMKDSENSNIGYIANEIRNELGEFNISNEKIADMLIKHLYGVKNSKSKESLWFCYGDIIVENLKRNIGNKTTVCQKCGKRFAPSVSTEKYCNNCKGYSPLETKTIACIDCGKKVKVDSKDNETCRCDYHRKEHIRLLRKEQNRRYYQKTKKHKTIS